MTDNKEFYGVGYGVPITKDLARERRKLYELLLQTAIKPGEGPAVGFASKKDFVEFEDEYPPKLFQRHYSDFGDVITMDAKEDEK